MADEAAELRFSAGFRRYIEHFVGHFSVRSVAFLLDASVESKILRGVCVDRVVLSRGEDNAVRLAMIAVQRIAYRGHRGERRGRGEGHKPHSAIDIEHIDRVVAGNRHDGVVLEGRARRQSYVDGRNAIHRVGMADELLEMKQLQLGDGDAVDLESKPALDQYADAIAAAADRDVLHVGRHRRTGDSLALLSQTGSNQTVKILKIATS